MGISSTSNSWRPGVIANTASRPSNPFEGQVVYQTDTNQTLVWDGAAWVDVSTGKAGKSGLVFVSSGTFTNTNTFTITGFGSVFSSYRVWINATRVSSSGTNELTAKLYNGATARNTEYYGAGWYVAYNSTSGVMGARNNQSDMWLGNVGSAGPSTSIFDCRGFTSAAFTCSGQAYDNQNIRNVTFSYLHNVSETNDSLVFTMSAANVTGDWAVYGYNQ